MEELRSTEILNKEIQSEAEKQAEKIIKDSLLEAEKIASEVNGRVDAAVDEKKAFFEAKVARAEKDLAARIPLEKQRFLVSYIQNSIKDSLVKYFDSLSMEKKKVLFENQLSKYKDVLKDKKVNLFYINFDKKDAEAVASSVLGAGRVLSSLELKRSDFLEDQNFATGFILVSEDESVKCRVTFAEIALELKDKYNFELAEKLFNGRLPE